MPTVATDTYASILTVRFYNGAKEVSTPEHFQFGPRLCNTKKKGEFSVYVLCIGSCGEYVWDTNLKITLRDVMFALEMSRCDQGLAARLKGPTIDGHRYELTQGIAEHGDLTFEKRGDNVFMIFRVFDYRSKVKLPGEAFPYEF